jgi:hypothetical protein
MACHLLPTVAVTLFLNAACFAATDPCTYNSLHALMDDLHYNDVKREQILTDDALKGCVVTVTDAAVFKVAKRKQDGKEFVVVLTYEETKEKVLFGAVYVGMTDVGQAADLHHDENRDRCREGLQLGT